MTLLSESISESSIIRVNARDIATAMGASGADAAAARLMLQGAEMLLLLQRRADCKSYCSAALTAALR
jgi:hypothetical protein